MNHTLAVTAAALLIVALLVLAALALTGALDTGASGALASESGVSESASEAEKTMYLGIFEGKLALFVGESPYPNVVYDVMVRTLPEADRIRLAEGIPVADEAELARLLEDYTS